ncbi:hypothetical protein CDAR_213551 [Caerostris darwini]|uniref:Uncharacterized protein n=1 Tax=Caerostris darwini TaxID=1538125 RepID=A0AAV4T5Z7_9ARAC|nr:hypothetical protein CDAR_213551 [Caerostris darwini]
MNFTARSDRILCYNNRPSASNLLPLNLTSLKYLKPNRHLMFTFIEHHHIRRSKRRRWGKASMLFPAIRLHAIVKSDVTSSGDLIPWAGLSEGGSEDFMKERGRQDNENIKTEPMENVLVVALSFGEASYVAFWE